MWHRAGRLGREAQKTARKFLQLFGVKDPAVKLERKKEAKERESAKGGSQSGVLDLGVDQKGAVASELKFLDIGKPSD